MPLSEIFPLERDAPEEQLSATVRQLEALTALAAAPGEGRALEELFAGLADTITGLTDYRTCLVMLFSEDGESRRILSYSSNIPREYIEASGTRPYRARGRRAPRRARRPHRGRRARLRRLLPAEPPPHPRRVFRASASRRVAAPDRPATARKPGTTATSCSSHSRAGRRVHRHHSARRPALGPRARPPQRPSGRRLRATDRAAHRPPARRRRGSRRRPSARRSSTASRAPSASRSTRRGLRAATSELGPTTRR